MNKLERSPQGELSNLSLRELQKIGIESPANLAYRVEISKRIAKSSGSSKAFLYDDITTSNATPWRINGIQMYERLLLSGLLLAPGFENGASSVISAPPAKAEMKSIKKIKGHLEETLGKKVSYEILFEHQGNNIDLMTLTDTEYADVTRSFSIAVADGDNAHFGANYHVNVIKDRLGTLPPYQKALIIPHERKKGHDGVFKKELDAGKVVLQDIPAMDKVHNYFVLREQGFKHLPEMIIVSSEGKIIETHEDLLNDEATNSGRPKTPENVTQFARIVLESVDKLYQEKGMDAYVVLDPERASGSGNLDPGIADYAKVYDHSIDFEIKQQILEKAINTMFEDTLPPRALVSEFVEMDEKEGQKQDFTARGQMVEGVFLPSSISLSGTTNAKYNRQWASLKAGDMGDNQDEWREMLTITAEAANILSEYDGYKSGNFAVEIFKRKDGTFALHDYNHRRGGASAPEAILPFLANNEQKVLFKARVQIPIPEIPLFDRVALYEQTTDHLFDEGIISFATSSRFDQQNGQDTATFNLLMITDMITGPEGSVLPQSQHLAYATMKAQTAMQSAYVQ